MEDLANYPGLEQRNKVYRVRWRIPAEVSKAVQQNKSMWQRNVLSNDENFAQWKRLATPDGALRKVVTKSLRTKDYRTAVHRYVEEAAELNSIYASVLLRLTTKLSEPTKWDAERIADTYFQTRNAEDVAGFVTPPEFPEDAEHTIREDLAFAANASEHSRRDYQRVAQVLLEKNHFDGDPETDGAEHLIHYLRRADLELGRRNLDRLKGNFSFEKTDQLFVQNSPHLDAETRLFAEVFDEYVAAKQREVRSTKTVPGYLFLRRIIAETVGVNEPITSFNRAKCRVIRDTLMLLPANSSKKKETRNLTISEAAKTAKRLNLQPMSKTTANGYLSVLSSFFKWAVREEYAERNPAEGLNVGKERTLPHRKRRSFNTDELNRIFSAPLYTGCVNDEHGYAKVGPNVLRRGRFWVPLISLWTGMRLGEICQLTTNDIVESGGVACVVTVWDVDEEDTDHSLEEQFSRTQKTDAAARLIPIHPQLIRLGFMEFVDAKRSASHSRLFDEIQPDTAGYLSGNFSKWFGRFLEKVQVKRTRNCFHSFRHTYRDAMRRAGVSRDTVVSIGGWAETLTSDIYGDGNAAAVAQKELERIEFEGLDLTHLHQNKV